MDCSHTNCPYAIVAPADPSVGIFFSCVEDCACPEDQPCPIEAIKEADEAEQKYLEYMDQLAREIFSDEVN